MTFTPWKMTLTIHADRDAVQSMRDYLRERGIIIPMRHRDVVSKCMQRLIENGLARTSIAAASFVSSPYWLRDDPDSRRLENDFWADIGLTRPVRAQLLRLAHGAFGLLFLLACYYAFAG